MTSCEEEYQDHPRGPDCYCTLYHGCFHRHFQIKPQIVDGAGLIPGKDKGIHDSDYFIEITIVNKALLKSVLRRKVRIFTGITIVNKALLKSVLRRKVGIFTGDNNCQ
jgi:hypothetical protein